VLLDYADLDRCIAETDVPNLYVLPSGPLPPSPEALVGSQRMRRLIEELGTRADVVLFDSPPVLACADAMVLASQTDGVVFVIDSGSTRRQAAKRALELLRNVDAKVLGGVLNKMHARSSEYYYYHSDGRDKKKSLWARWTAPVREALGRTETRVRQQLFGRKPVDD
jgi:capsular exopolysaccharide synthesis family protein